MSGRRAEMLNFGRNLALEEEKGILWSSRGGGSFLINNEELQRFPQTRTLICLTTSFQYSFLFSNDDIQ